MFSNGSKRKSAVVLVPSEDVQLPAKAPSSASEGEQLNVLPFAELLSVKDGPESSLSFGSIGEAPGSILKLRCQFSILHDWYSFDVSTHVGLAFSEPGTNAVAILRLGRVPESVLFGTQWLLSSAVVQLTSRVIDPVASP